MRKYSEDDEFKKEAAKRKAGKAWRGFLLILALGVGWLWYLLGYTQGMENQDYRPGMETHATK